MSCVIFVHEYLTGHPRREPGVSCKVLKNINKSHSRVSLSGISTLKKADETPDTNPRGWQYVRAFTVRAFTLIELLVVVLIIGILAAIALPQYRVAVLKARATEGIVQLDALMKAEIIYKLANGDYSDDMDALDITAFNVSFLTKVYVEYNVGNGLFLEWVWPTTKWPQGQRRCIATPLGHQTCKSLGATPMEHSNNTDTTTYYLFN